MLWRGYALKHQSMLSPACKNSRPNADALQANWSTLHNPQTPKRANSTSSTQTIKDYFENDSHPFQLLPKQPMKTMKNDDPPPIAPWQTRPKQPGSRILYKKMGKISSIGRLLHNSDHWACNSMMCWVHLATMENLHDYYNVAVLVEWAIPKANYLS